MAQTNFTHIEAERALVATLFNDEQAREKIFSQAGLLTIDHFANRILGLAFGALQELHLDGTKPELFPLLAKMEGAGNKLTDKDRNLLTEACATLEATVALETCVRLIVAKHTARASEALAHELAKTSAAAVDPEGIDSAITAAQQRLSEMQEGLLGKKRQGGRKLNDYLGEAIDTLQTLHDREDQSPVTGIPSGINDLDIATTGFHPGEMIVVGGRPSMGKTAMAARLIDSAAMYSMAHLDNGAVACYSMEMLGASLANRFLAMKGRIDMQALRTGKLQDEHWDKLTVALGKLYELPITICDEVAITPSYIRHDLRMQRRKNGRIAMVVVDYLQLMETGGRYDKREGEVSAISRSMKKLSLEFECPVVALSQLNRDLEKRTNKRPIMADLRESGAIEQDADVILFMYRDEVYNPDSQDKGIVELILGKQRNGPLTTVPAAFVGEYASIENLARQGGSWNS